MSNLHHNAAAVVTSKVKYKMIAILRKTMYLNEIIKSGINSNICHIHNFITDKFKWTRPALTT